MSELRDMRSRGPNSPIAGLIKEEETIAHNNRYDAYLIPLFKDLPDNVFHELDRSGIDPYYGSSVNAFKWIDCDHLPEFKLWAVQSFGPDIKLYTHYAIDGPGTYPSKTPGHND